MCVYACICEHKQQATKAKQNGDTSVHTRLCTCTYKQMSSYLRIAILAKGEPRFILSPPSTHNTSWVFGLAVVAVRPELPHLDAERWGDYFLQVFHYFLAVGIISATATPTFTSVMPGVLGLAGSAACGCRPCCWPSRGRPVDAKSLIPPRNRYTDESRYYT